MAKKTIFRENYLTHKPNGFTPDEYEKYGHKLDSHSFRKNINNEKENKEPQKESRNMAKDIIRLTESDLHRIVKESVRRIIKEDVALPVKEAYENMIQAMENFETSVVENMNVQNDDGRYQSLDDALTKAKYAAENIVNRGFKHPHPNAFR